MCITLHKLFKCGCKEVKRLDPCPMMDEAIDLVDEQGVPEEDPRIANLEVRCQQKSAERYEVQGDNCDLCKTYIARVGFEVWLKAKKKRDIDEESAWLAKMGEQDAAEETAAHISEPGMLCMTQPGGKEIELDDKRNTPVNCSELQAALTTLLETRISAADYYDSEDVYDPADYDSPVGALGSKNGEGPSSQARQRSDRHYSRSR